MSASRAFIDVLVGKLTAYVDVSSRPAPSICTPHWVRSLDALPVTPRAASRAYADQEVGGHSRQSANAQSGQAATHTDAGTSGPHAHTHGAPRLDLPTRPHAGSAARGTAIQLLQRLGAASIDVYSTDAEIRSACRQLTRAFHPDAHPDARDADRAVLTARLRAVIVARDILDARTTAGTVAA